jgi:tol-pal system beta propeller repeat protein TolB
VGMEVYFCGISVFFIEKSYFMKPYIFFIAASSVFVVHTTFNTITSLSNNNISFSVDNTTQKYSPIKCFMFIKGNDPFIEKLSKIVKFDLEFTDQINVDIKQYEKKITLKNIYSLFKQDISLCLIMESVNNSKVNILLKDTYSNNTLFEQEISYSKQFIIRDGHAISDKLIPSLTGEQGISSSCITYCKQFSSNRKAIFISDYVGREEQLLVSGNKLNVAPCWHSSKPLLFFSQFSPMSSRLISYDVKTKRQKVICPYDGLNMQPSFSHDGKQVVVCMSARTGNSELYLYDQLLCKKVQKRVFVPLTSNGGNNSSPHFINDGAIIFCSDFETGLPQVYRLNLKSKKVNRFTNGHGYCASPAYSKKTGDIAYIRPINKIFQLCSININDPKLREKRLTSCVGDKLDPSWSPCGRHIAFIYDFKNNKGKRIPQIATLTLSSRKIRIITNNNYPKSFPIWTNPPFS